MVEVLQVDLDEVTGYGEDEEHGVGEMEGNAVRTRLVGCRQRPVQSTRRRHPPNEEGEREECGGGRGVGVGGGGGGGGWVLVCSLFLSLVVSVDDLRHLAVEPWV